ncbi:M48 family metalloprotease [Streptomyces sp. NPDC056796]|uniref:M48 family metalloprotease n=1 Tax=unclassified Streptomyces TaxID=2593676 RepID=UPI00369C6E50
MRLAVYLPLLFPVLAAPAAGPLARRLEPRLATWLLTAAGLLLAAGSTAVLGLLALAGLVRVPLIASLKELSPAAVARHDPATAPVALAAGALLVAVCCAAAAVARSRVSALWASARDAACLPGRDPVHVTENAGAEAYTMPGLPGRIVVSTGMLAALDPREREVLLAHEHAHLRHHHYAFVTLTHLSAAANPLLRPLTTAVAYTVERWADEQAADTVGDRGTVARTVGKAAIAAKRTRGRDRSPAGALGVLGRRAVGPGAVPRRVAALLAPAPGSRPLLVLAAVALMATTGACMLEAVLDLHQFLELAELR